MGGPRLDVGFIPVECPGNTGRGAMHTSTLLIERLSRHHDLTVYVASQRQADPDAFPARDRVDYVVHDGLDWLPHPIRSKHAAIRGEREALGRHDMIHSYSSGFIPILATLDVPTLVTLNSYLPICPKANFRYHATQSCTGPGAMKCAGCIPATAVNRRQGVIPELKSAYFNAGRWPFVRDSIAHRHGITRYQALSPHVRRDFAGVGFDPDRIRVIPHFYDEQFLVEGENGSRSQDPARLLYVGTLKEMKGIDVLVRALPHLVGRGIEFELDVVGSGPLEDRVHRLAAELEVDSHVNWRGYVEYEELPRHYRASDIFVYPGVLDEPFGRVMLEALASGTPIVSSDIGSMETIVGPAGELFESEHPEDLARAVEQVLDDRERYRSAIDDHLAQFSPETVIGQFDELYRETAGTSVEIA